MFFVGLSFFRPRLGPIVFNLDRMTGVGSENSKATVWLACLVLLLLLASLSPSLAAEPEASLRVKNVEFNGDLGFTVAEFGLTFDQDLIFEAPAHCPAGRFATQATPAYLDANPCAFMACDFTLKGPDCGKARLPECEALCASQRPSFCPAIQDWTVLTLNQESEPVRLSDRGEPVLFRVNFDQPLKALAFDYTALTGILILAFSVTRYDPDVGDTCALALPPDGTSTICPSYAQCYKYGTYFLSFKGYQDEAFGTVTVRTVDIEPGPQRTASPPGAPPVVPQPNYPFHVPLQWSVPFTYQFQPFQAAIPMIISTHYCGFVTFQAVLEEHSLPFESSSMFLSIDPSNPFPSSLNTDMIYLNMPATKMWVCQDDTSLPPLSIFMLFVRGTTNELTATFTLTVEYDRPELIPRLPPQKVGDIGISSQHLHFPPGKGWIGYAAGAIQVTCPTDITQTATRSLRCLIGCQKFGCCSTVWPAFPPAPSLPPFFPLPHILPFL